MQSKEAKQKKARNLLVKNLTMLENSKKRGNAHRYTDFESLLAKKKGQICELNRILGYAWDDYAAKEVQ